MEKQYNVVIISIEKGWRRIKFNSCQAACDYVKALHENGNGHLILNKYYI